MKIKKQYYLSYAIFPRDEELMGYKRSHGLICETRDNIETWYDYNHFEIGVLFAKVGVRIHKKKQ